MSYSRWGEGDIYLYKTFNGEFVCQCCTTHGRVVEPDPGDDDLFFPGDWVGKSTQEALDHVKQHAEKGDYVPPRAFLRLEEELEEELRNAPQEKASEK